jgi:hypothetical protein
MLFSLGLFASSYLAGWAFKVQLGLIRPRANLAYFTYSECESLDRDLYLLCWPCMKAWPPGVVHHSDRVYPAPEHLSVP